MCNFPGASKSSEMDRRTRVITSMWGLGGQEEWWCHCFMCYSSFCAADARVLHSHLHSVSASSALNKFPLHWRKTIAMKSCTTVAICNLFFFAVSLPFYSTCVSSTVENENGDTKVETRCSCYVAVTPVCSLCRIMTTDRSTASINPTSLARLSAATTNCIKNIYLKGTL